MLYSKLYTIFFHLWGITHASTLKTASATASDASVSVVEQAVTDSSDMLSLSSSMEAIAVSAPTGRRIVRAKRAFRSADAPDGFGLPVSRGSGAAMTISPPHPRRQVVTYSDALLHLSSALDETLTIMSVSIGRTPGSLQYITAVARDFARGSLQCDSRNVWIKIAFLAIFIHNCKIQTLAPRQLVEALVRDTGMTADAVLPRILQAAAEVEGDYSQPTGIITGLINLANSRLVNEVLAQIESAREATDRSAYRIDCFRFQAIADAVYSDIAASHPHVPTSISTHHLAVQVFQIAPSTLIQPLLLHSPLASLEVSADAEVVAVADVMNTAEPIYGDSSLPEASARFPHVSTDAVSAIPVDGTS